MKDLKKNKLYKKTRKLIKDPIASWNDTRINPKNIIDKLVIERFENLVKSNEIENFLDTNQTEVIIEKVDSQQKNLEVVDEFNFEYILNLLSTNGFNGIYIIPVERSLKCALAVLQKQKLEAITKLLYLVTKEDLEIRYKVQGKIVNPESPHMLWNDIKNLKYVDIRLSTSRLLDEKKGIQWFRLEFWEENEEYYVSPVSNHISRKLWKQTAEKYDLFEDGLKDYSCILNCPHSDVVDFDVDLVFTWVNADDEDWIEMYNTYNSFSGKTIDSLLDSNNETLTDAESNSRFVSRDELKYSLRSWDKYGSFVRNIYVVSNCKPPEWLNLSQKNIFWVDHKEIIDDEFLPTFSSHAIEANLHKIKGISNFFIYCNDDILLLKPQYKDHYYYSNGIAKLRFENYGNVNGDAMEGDPDYLNAARNGVKLLEKVFNKTVTELHTHSPQSMRVDVLKEMNNLFYDNYVETQSNRFRSMNDISITSFLYQHFAKLDGKALGVVQKTILIKENSNYSNSMRKILRLHEQGHFNSLPLSVCINDGAESHLNDNWNKNVIEFCNKLFPHKSKFEL